MNEGLREIFEDITDRQEKIIKRHQQINDDIRACNKRLAFVVALQATLIACLIYSIVRNWTS